MMRVVMTLILGLLAWVVLGYLATMPLGAIFGWSGHPALPDAPLGVYIGLYLVLLPTLCFAGPGGSGAGSRGTGEAREVVDTMNAGSYFGRPMRMRIAFPTDLPGPAQAAVLGDHG
jgi:hypothetical protein